MQTRLQTLTSTCYDLHRVFSFLGRAFSLSLSLFPCLARISVCLCGVFLVLFLLDVAYGTGNEESMQQSRTEKQLHVRLFFCDSSNAAQVWLTCSFISCGRWLFGKVTVESEVGSWSARIPSCSSCCWTWTNRLCKLFSCKAFREGETLQLLVNKTDKPGNRFHSLLIADRSLWWNLEWLYLDGEFHRRESWNDRIVRRFSDKISRMSNSQPIRMLNAAWGAQFSIHHRYGNQRRGTRYLRDVLLKWLKYSANWCQYLNYSWTTRCRHLMLINVMLCRDAVDGFPASHLEVRGEGRIARQRLSIVRFQWLDQREDRLSKSMRRRRLRESSQSMSSSSINIKSVRDPTFSDEELIFCDTLRERRNRSRLIRESWVSYIFLCSHRYLRCGVERKSGCIKIS